MDIMTFFSVSGLLNGISCFLLGIFIFLQNKKNSLNKTYFYFAISVSVWSFGYYFWPLAQDKTYALNSFRLLHLGAVFIPIFYYHFTLIWTGQLKDRLLSLKVGYVVAITTVFFVPTNLYIYDMVPKFIFKFWAVPGFLYHFFLLYFFYYVGMAVYVIYLEFKRSEEIRKKQCKFVLIATIVGYLGGSTNFPLWYNIPVYPIVNCLVTLYVGIVAYAILRHKFMNIEVIIKKSLVFAGMFVLVFSVFVGVTLLVTELLGGSRGTSLVLSAAIIIFLLKPVEAWLVNVTDKFLFQKKYEYKQILKTFIDEVITVLNLDEIINSTLDLLDKTIHPSVSSVFILNGAEDKYQLYNSRGLENKDVVFDSGSKLVTFLKTTQDPSMLKPIEGYSELDESVKENMSLIKACVCLPLTLHDDLIGFVALGNKKSDDDYTSDDIDVLLALARTESIAVGNAQLLQEAAQSERRAAIGTMAAGIYHEIGNPINIINTKIQVFLAGVNHGFFEGKRRQEILEECQGILKETMSQTDRIADITRRLSNFAKPSKEFKPQLINIYEEIEEALSVVGHDLELEKIKIDLAVPKDMPKILADKRGLQQIFFNLIRNAGQAIEGSGTITLRAEVTSENKLRLEIEDTGKGIPADKREKVFDPFFTTKGPKKGTGLGLSIVRQLVWRNKGEITFTSEVGKGTTFILEFPIAAKRV